MGTKKSNKIYAAAAALAVTASAVAPGLSADAASKVTVKSVTNPKSISHYGGSKFAVKKLTLPKTVKVTLSNKKTENRSVKWTKVSYDAKYIGKYQTLKGTVSGTSIKASLKVKLNNYPIDVIEPKLAPVAVGEEVKLPNTIDVKYKNGKVVARSINSFEISKAVTDKVGKGILVYKYAGKNSEIKGSIGYEVKAAEISNIASSEADYELSVSADVKYPAKDAKAELIVLPYKNEAAAMTVPAELKDGKFTAKAKDLPVGAHSFIVKVGEVKSQVQDFVVEGAKVLSVDTLNGTQLEVKFNKAIDAKSVLTDGGDLKDGVITLSSLDGVNAGTLKAEVDGKKLVITTTNAISKRYDLTIDKVKSAKGADIAKFFTTINVAADTTAPMIVSTEKLDASRIKVKFSEPVQAFNDTTFKYADGTSANVSGTIAAGATEAIFTIDGSVAAGKEITGMIVGLKDVAGNIISPNPTTFKFQKGAKDGVAPVVTSVTAMGTTKLEVKFSEELLVAPTVKVGNNEAVALVQDSADKTKYVATFDSVTGLQNVVIGAATDLSGQEGVAVTRIVEFKADTIAPKLVSSKVVVDATDKKEYLELAFDEEITKGADFGVTGSYVKDYVTYNVNLSGKSFSATTDKKVVRIALADLLGVKSVEGAAYKLTLSNANGLVQDAAATPNFSAKAIDVSFTRGKDGVPASALKTAVTSFVADEDNNSATITFSEEVDGLTATSVANYKIDGAVIEKATLLEGGKIVKLSIKAGSNTFTGLRNVSVEGVKTKASMIEMDKFTGQVSFSENVAPTVTSAKLVATDKIELTFSEAVTSGGAFDFETLVESKTTLGSENVVVASGKGTITLDLPVTADQLSKGLSLKALNTLDIVDAAGNKLSVPANITVTN